MEDLLPDPGHHGKTAAYIYQQAELGNFDHAHDVAVLQYLWLNAWRTPKNRENAPAGMVLQSKTAVPKISAATMLGRTSVKAALRRLRHGGWIETEQGVHETGWKAANFIFCRMDMTAHRERERARSVMAEVERFMGAEGRVATDLVGRDTTHL